LMKYIVTEPQLSVFLRRRVSPEELEEMVNHTKKQIDGGEKVGYAVRESIRSFLDKTLPETHDVAEYWNYYHMLEKPLVAYIKFQLGFR